MPREGKTAVSFALFFHPLTTFIAGILLAVAAIACLVLVSARPNSSGALVGNYHRKLEIAGKEMPAGSSEEKAAVERFTGFLQRIGDPKSIRENTRKVYAEAAFLDDTLVVHEGAGEIQSYFLETAANMTRCEVTIDDVARSGPDYYVRWTMAFEVPALAGGEPVHSIGISQVRFDESGKVCMHQDFWDSGKNLYAHLPVAGGVIGFIRKRLER